MWKYGRRIFWACPVPVIDFCDLEFICDLVLGIWNLNLVG